MKMKKMIFLLLVLQLFCVASIAQEKAKPTKQETMDWIAGKFKAHINDSKYAGVTQHNTWSYQFIKYDGKIINYLENQLSDNDGKSQRTYYAIDLTKVTAIVSSSENRIQIQGKDAGCYNQKEDSSDKRCGVIDLLFVDAKYQWVLIKFDDEPNLKERMIKAFQTLAEYNLAEKPFRYVRVWGYQYVARWQLRLPAEAT